MNLIKKRWGFMPIVDLKKEKKRKREKEKKRKREKKKMVPPLSESLTRFTMRHGLFWEEVRLDKEVRDGNVQCTLSRRGN